MAIHCKLKLRQFNLISTAIQGLLKQTDHVQGIESSCTLFATFGAAVLNHHLKIPCRAVAGALFLHHPDGERVLTFGQEEKGRIQPSEDCFHMWVQTETHIIDFMSPIYPEVSGAVHAVWPLPRRMPQLDQKFDAEDMGTFYRGAPLMTLPDKALTETLIESVVKRPANRDLIEVLLAWWPRLKKASGAAITLAASDGERLKIRRSGYQAKGLWKGPSVVKPQA